MANEYEDDPELLQGISDGNVDALAGFLDVNRRQLMAFISRRLGDALRTKVEVEDIFQDVSAEAIRTLTPEWPTPRRLTPTPLPAMRSRLVWRTPCRCHFRQVIFQHPTYAMTITRIDCKCCNN